MRGVVVVITAFAVLAGCCPCRKQYTASKADSVRIEYRERIVPQWRDTIIYIDVERERVAEVADSTSHLECRFAVSDASIIGGRLHHSLTQRQQTVGQPAKVEERIVYRDSVVYRDRQQVEVREVYVLHWWQRILCWLGAVLGGLSALGIAFKLGKFL